MPGGSPQRRSYLLRVWEERGEPAGGRALRYSLQEARGEQRAGFGSLEALVAYLRAQLGPEDGAEWAADEAGGAVADETRERPGR